MPNRSSTITSTVCFLACACAVAVPVHAESLEAEVRQAIMAPGEPFVVNVTWRLDEPLPDPVDARQATENHFRIPRRATAVLFEDQEPQCDFTLFPVSRFASVAGSDTDYSAVLLGFPLRYDKQDRERVYFTRPGRYTLTVKATTSQGSAMSHSIPITIRRARGNVLRALELWEGLGVATVSMVVEQKGDQETVETFRRLAKDYPETPYGRYARASIALWDFSDTAKRYDDKGGPDIWTPVADELRIAAAALYRLPTLRKKALFDLVGAEICAGAYGSARKVAETIQKDFSDEDTRRKVDGIQRHLANRKRR